MPTVFHPYLSTIQDFRRPKLQWPALYSFGNSSKTIFKKVNIKLWISLDCKTLSIQSYSDLHFIVLEIRVKLWNFLGEKCTKTMWNRTIEW